MNVRILITRKNILFMNPLIFIASFAFFIALNLTLFFLIWLLFSLSLLWKIFLFMKRNFDFFGSPWENDTTNYRVLRVSPG